jgi:hypothetical protein
LRVVSAFMPRRRAPRARARRGGRPTTNALLSAPVSRWQMERSWTRCEGYSSGLDPNPTRAHLPIKKRPIKETKPIAEVIIRDVATIRDVKRFLDDFDFGKAAEMLNKWLSRVTGESKWKAEEWAKCMRAISLKPFINNGEGWLTFDEAKEIYDAFEYFEKSVKSGDVMTNYIKEGHTMFWKTKKCKHGAECEFKKNTGFPCAFLHPNELRVCRSVDQSKLDKQLEDYRKNGQRNAAAAANFMSSFEGFVAEKCTFYHPTGVYHL